MRKAFRHTGVLMMVAVVALGLMGAAYTLWYEKLTFTATVTTGELDVDWSDHGATEIVSLNQGQTWGPPAHGKSTTICAPTTAYPTAGLDINANDPQTINLNVFNAFPYSGCEALVDVTNDGTIPVHLEFTNVTGTGLDEIDFEYKCYTRSPAVVDFIYTPLVLLANGQYQLHPGQTIWCKVKVWLEQGDNELKSFTASFMIIARQYNEDQAPLPNVAPFDENANAGGNDADSDGAGPEGPGLGDDAGDLTENNDDGVNS